MFKSRDERVVAGLAVSAQANVRSAEIANDPDILAQCFATREDIRWSLSPVRTLFSKTINGSIDQLKSFLVEEQLYIPGNFRGTK